MRVSVIIPTYNHRDYVLQTLDSVFAQTFSDYEVIVINDGSPDDTSDLLQPLAQAGRIRYIEQPNAGQAAARNRGLEAAHGEFIAFLDDDDLWPQDKLQWQVEFLEHHRDVAVVGGSVQHIDGQGLNRDEVYFHDRPITFESLFSGCPFVSPGQTLIRASVLKKVGGLNEKLWGVGDYDLWFRLLGSETISAQPQLSLYYRYHATNASNNIAKMLSNILKVVQQHLPKAPASKRSQYSRDTYRWLYQSVGDQIIGGLKVNKLRARQDFKNLSLFVWPAMRDRRLLRSILHDLTPRALKARKR